MVVFWVMLSYRKKRGLSIFLRDRVYTKYFTLSTAKQISELQKRNAQLEEENIILKKAIAIFTPHSSKD